VAEWDKYPIFVNHRMDNLILHVLKDYAAVDMTMGALTCLNIYLNYAFEEFQTKNNRLQ
jgi:hypothetical protein